MNFGTLSTVVGTETATSNVTVRCSAGTAYQVSFRANRVLA
jgi:spore coat protein U-like protein